MRWSRLTVGLLVFLCLMLPGASGLIQGQEAKQLMLVFTTNTEGELNACG